MYAYTNVAYSIAFVTMMDIVEDDVWESEDFRYEDIAEGRRKEITRAWLYALPESERSDVLGDCADNLDWLLKDPLGLITDRCTQDIGEALEVMAAESREADAADREANKADDENDIRWIA